VKKDGEQTTAKDEKQETNNPTKGGEQTRQTEGYETRNTNENVKENGEQTRQTESYETRNTNENVKENGEQTRQTESHETSERNESIKEDGKQTKDTIGAESSQKAEATAGQESKAGGEVKIEETHERGADAAAMQAKASVEAQYSKEMADLDKLVIEQTNKIQSELQQMHFDLTKQTRDIMFKEKYMKTMRRIAAMEMLVGGTSKGANAIKGGFSSTLRTVS
jgi:hypothetical protein